MGLKSVSIFLKIAVPVSILAFLFHLIGYGSNSWQKSQVDDQVVAEEGLWNLCNYALRLTCYTFTEKDEIADELRSVRALATIALIMLGVVAVATFLSLCLSFLRNKLFGTLNMLTALAAGGIIIVAIIIYGSTVIPPVPTVHWSWSMGLCIVGAILGIVTGILIGVGVFTGGSSSSESS